MRRNIPPVVLLFLAGSAQAASTSPEFGAEAAARWLQRHATPIKTVDPSVDGADLAPLLAVADRARIAGFGEATHGSREFFLLKDRAFRHLVGEGGYRGFAIEANFAAAEAIDDWVKGGEGDPEALVGGLGFWTWDTEEVLALVQWMRAYNAQAPEKIGFYGVDIQHAAPNLRIALDFLYRIDPGWPTGEAAFAGYLAAAENQRSGYRHMATLKADDARALREAAERIVLRLESKADIYRAAGDDAWLAALSGATAATWYFRMEGPREDRRFRNLQTGYDIRDRAMADLAILASRRLGPGRGLFVWAHNAHVANAPFVEARMTMGQFLKQDIGDGYVSIGFAFDRGSFQAFPPADPARPEEKPRLSVMTVGPAPPDHSEAVLRKASAPIWIADLRAVPAGTPAQAWFATPRPLRWTGAAYSTELMARHWPVGLGSRFDALLFIAETSRARPLRATRERQGLQKDW